ncbi:MAG: serine/threonine protein kinase, partial [Geminicoccaceae bacterium]|nr:serine/threonine protein kinase [Geminicoccaceae bacterium]
MQPGDRIGRYELVEQLGEGAMSVVWLASDPLLERRLAIKVLRPEARHDRQYVERFLEDARAAARLNHPNIVRVVDVDNSDEAPCIIMEVVDGPSLEAWLEEAGRVETGTAASIARDIASALAAAHAAGIVHRDVKPSNVLLDRETRQARLTDFGAAKREERTTDTELTTHGQLIGTPRYMAPEQINGDPVSPRTDLFALGATLFEMLAGRPAFDARNRELLFRAILIDPTPDISAVRDDVPAGLAALVGELLSRSVEDRPQSAADVASRLGAFTGPEQQSANEPAGAGVVAAAASPPVEPPKREMPPPVIGTKVETRPARSGRAGRMAFGAGLLAIMAGAAWWLMQPPGESVIEPEQPAIADATATGPGSEPEPEPEPAP